jgi:multiple sugar transport system ATP-binding protein
VEQDTVVLDCGVRFALSLQSKIATGTEIICGFRPHQISLSNEGVSVEVLLVEPAGEGQEMQLRTGDQDITIVTNDEPDTKVGQMVELSFDTSKALLFEKRSEDRLR